MAGRLQRLDTLEAAYEAAVAMLARKARTATEVASALAEKGASPDDVESVVARLKAHRHLDDVTLAHDEAASLLDGKGLAPAAAVESLVQRGIAEGTARDAVDTVREGRSDLELCGAALARRLRGRALAPADVGREGRALARVGWDEEVVLRVLERAARSGAD